MLRLKREAETSSESFDVLENKCLEKTERVLSSESSCVC
jgi:hypothetical protein